MSLYRDRLRAGCEYQVGWIANTKLPAFMPPNVDAKILLDLKCPACTHPNRKRPECSSDCPAIKQANNNKE